MNCETCKHAALNEKLGVYYCDVTQHTIADEKIPAYCKLYEAGLSQTATDDADLREKINLMTTVLKSQNEMITNLASRIEALERDLKDLRSDRAADMYFSGQH